MAIPKNFRDGTVVVNDGSATPLSLPIAFIQGDFSISGEEAGNTEHSAYQSRGVLIGLRKTSALFQSGSFSLILSEFTLASGGTLLDMIKGTGAFASRRSTTEAKGDVMTFDLVWTIEGTDLGDSSDHVATMSDCHLTFDIGEGDPNTISCSFTCYGGIVYS